MSDVVLFHHVAGLTDGVRRFADRLAAGGHRVVTPDLLEGRTFASVDEGMAHVQEVGFDTVLGRAAAAVADQPGRLVYAGFSMGVLAVQMLAQTRPGAAGALMFEACVPPSEFGPPWPADFPFQVHGMTGDPFFSGEGDVDTARQLVDASSAGELFLYPGDSHLFADDSLASFDPAAAGLLVERARAFLDRVGRAGRRWPGSGTLMP